MRRLMYLTMICVVLLLGVVGSPSLAQDDSCPALVEQALSAIGNNCGGMARNSVCYGFNRVDATFNTTVDAGFFSQPADTADLVMVQSLQTAPMDTIQQTWGAAVLNVQANVPNTLPGQAVVFLLLGDAHVENATPLESAFTPVDPVTTQIVTAANIRSGPGTHTNVIGSVPAGILLAVDGISPDNEWYRVVYYNGLGWIHRSVISPVDGLPVISESTRGVMQSFYFSTGTGQSACNEAAGLLVVQGPRGIQVDLTVNGAEIAIGSTIALTTSDSTLHLYVLDGQAIVSGGLIIPAGFAISASLDASSTVVPGSWTNTRPMNETDLSLFRSLESVDSTVLNYAIQPPTQEQITQTTNALSGGTSGTISGRTSNSAIDAVNCDGFIVTSPIGALPYGAVSFYWNPAVGATQYRVSIYSPTAVGAVNTLLVDGSRTSVDVDAANLGGGNAFSWEVTALFNGQDACTTGRAALTRAAGPDVVGGGAAPVTGDAGIDLQTTAPSGFTFRVQCLVTNWVFSWSNAQPADTITVQFGNAIDMGTRFGSGASGSISTPWSWPVDYFNATTTSGDNVTINAASLWCP